MKKYFEENRAESLDLMSLHSVIGESAYTVLDNLMFEAARPEEARTAKHRRCLAGSAYILIALCEAVIDRVPEDEAEAEFRSVAEDMRPRSREGVRRELADLLNEIMG